LAGKVGICPAAGLAMVVVMETVAEAASATVHLAALARAIA
jgi:hypothetical protein